MADVPRASNEASDRPLTSDPSSVPHGPSDVMASNAPTSGIHRPPDDSGLAPSAQPAPPTTKDKAPADGTTPRTSIAERPTGQDEVPAYGAGNAASRPIPHPAEPRTSWEVSVEEHGQAATHPNPAAGGHASNIWRGTDP